MIDMSDKMDKRLRIRFSARAGHSEHQTGLAIDVTADSVNGQLVTEFRYNS